MRFSAFTGFGHLRFSGRKPYGQEIYEDRVRNRGDGKVWTKEWGSLVSARDYATSMLIANARHFVERAGRQFRPTKAQEVLPVLERQYGLVPTSTATVPERQAELAAAMKISRGARAENVSSVLTDLLGTELIGYVTINTSSAVASSTTPGSVGNYPKAGSLSTVIALTDGVSTTASQTVPYTYVAGNTARLKAGQTIWVDGGHYGRAETVTLTAVTDTHITATFAKPHDAGTYATSARAPFLASTKRHNYVMLSAAAARNPEKRRKVHRAMRKLVRSVSTWDIVEENSPGSGVAGPFTIGSSEIGIHPIETVAA